MLKDELGKLELVKDLQASAAIQPSQLTRFGHVRKLAIETTSARHLKAISKAVLNASMLIELDIFLRGRDVSTIGAVNCLLERVRTLHLRMEDDKGGPSLEVEPWHPQYQLLRKVVNRAPGLQNLHLNFSLHVNPGLISASDWNRILPLLRTLKVDDEGELFTNSEPYPMSILEL